MKVSDSLDETGLSSYMFLIDGDNNASLFSCKKQDNTYPANILYSVSYVSPVSGIPNKIISASLSFGVYEYLSDTFDIDDHH